MNANKIPTNKRKNFVMMMTTNDNDVVGTSGSCIGKMRKGYESKRVCFNYSATATTDGNFQHKRNQIATEKITNECIRREKN